MASTDAHETDPTLLKDHSTIRSFKTTRFEYPSIRVFHRQHRKAAELPTSPGPLPLLVCIPGLGGSVAQFHPLLSSLVDLAPCLAIDWPGGGRSGFAPTDWEAYTTQALSELVETVVEEYRDKEAEQTVVLIGHSMGTTICAWLANRKVSHETQLADYVVALLAICPLSGPLDESKTTWVRRLMWIPGWIVDLLRGWDGIGGTESPSVARFLGGSADATSKTLQLRYNRQSRTPVWRRMLYGMQPVYTDGKAIGGVHGLDVWAGIDVPTYLIAGEQDKLTPPKEMEKILKVMRRDEDADSVHQEEDTHEPVVDAAAPLQSSLSPSDHIPHPPSQDKDTSSTTTGPQDDPSTPPDTPTIIPSQPRHPHRTVKSIIMPAPATHALLYTPCTVRALAGLIADFLSTHVTARLSLAWQLQYLSQEGKWDVKNLAKWRGVAPVSDPIGALGQPVFRALKTLREVDDQHSPSVFTAHWADEISDVVDISKDQPVYDPQGLEREGVHYHKFPTVSKVPPQPAEVDAFVALVDSLRGHRQEGKLIGVHCHYGFNRTGYFIVCYLVERCGLKVQDAVEAFAKARPNGIRHSHFLDRLYVRYSVEAAGS